MSAFSNINKFEGRSSLKTWLHRITVNAALMNCGLCRIEAPRHHIATPAEVLEREDARALIAAKIGELPDNYRIVLLLTDIEELSTIEVAGLLELTGSNVKFRLHRARAALKKLLEPLL